MFVCTTHSSLVSDFTQLLQQKYQESLGLRGKELEGTIALLEQTSVLISIFADLRPIIGPDDERLATLQQISKWFADWEAQVVSIHGSTKAQR